MKRLSLRGWAILFTVLTAAVMYIPAAPMAVLPAAHAEMAIELVGNNVLQGSDSGTVRVSLSREAEVTQRTDPNKAHQAMSAFGDGRATGFALVPVPNDEYPAGRFFIRNRMSWCDQPGCTPQGDLMKCGCSWLEGASKGFVWRSYRWPDGSIDTRVVLPAGDYLLYLVADGTPATVSFTLYEPLSGTPLGGTTDMNVTPAPSTVNIFSEVDPDRAPGHWESGANITARDAQSFWFASGWEIGWSSLDNPTVWGPAALCDYPGGRTATSSPCPVTIDYWNEQGHVKWRAMGPNGLSLVSTRDELRPNETYGIYFGSVVTFSRDPIDRGFLSIQVF